ncbi:hypothetical protein KC316_g22 [Hortaea werneckii]|nr:hypothetical protein KC316_g22 [Hortaea werneckii]
MRVTPHHASCLLQLVYSILTTPPRPFKVSTIFSASSLGTPSFITLGADSTNFLLSTKLSPSMFLISLMIFGLAAVSNESNFSVKSVFSSCLGAASSGSSAGAAAAWAGPAAANPPTGMSGILSRDWALLLRPSLLSPTGSGC